MRFPSVQRRRVELPVFIVAVLVLLAVWSLAAMRQTLWLDEFHSLLHASAPGLQELFYSVRADNHPPLSFLILRLSRSCFGEGDLALRIPSIVAGLGIVWLLLRSGPCRIGVRAALLFGVSSYSLVLVTDSRMYAWLALSVTGLWTAAETMRATGRGSVAIFAWSAIGLHTHYYFAYSAVMLLVVLAVDYRRRPKRRERILRSIFWMFAGLLSFLPWCYYGLCHQLTHGIRPGRSHTELVDFVTSMAHFFFIDVRASGMPGLFASLLGLAIVGGAICAMVWTWPMRAKDERRRIAEGAALALGAPLLAFIAVNTATRAGYNWKYVAGAAPITIWLVAQGLQPIKLRASRLPLVPTIAYLALVVTMAFVTAAAALDPGREDHRQAAKTLAREFNPKRHALFVEPIWSPNGEWPLAGWERYAPKAGLDPRLAIPLGAMVPEAMLQRPFFVLRRRALDEERSQKLRVTHRRRQLGDLGPDLTLERFTPCSP